MVILLLPAACGYTPILGTVSGGGSDIHVPLACNETAYPSLRGPLTEALRKRAARSGIEVVNRKKGVPSLEVTILRVQGEPGMLTTKDNRLIPVDSIWCISAEARLVVSNSGMPKELETFEVCGRAYSGGTVLAEESLGHRRRKALMDDLADAVVRHFFE
ncbi:MAG: hypothetical protein GY847_08870 [Proteobacteria bacterium]|nr:hypothetical protein [Pseudomonadota bacterium]